jgi:hypothetical protein
MVACIIFEDHLDGISNYLQWKVWMSFVLKENKIWNYVNYVVVAPTKYLIALDFHDVKEAKYHRIILYGVKEHLIPYLVEKKTTKEMWMHLKKKLRRRMKTGRKP